MPTKPPRPNPDPVAEPGQVSGHDPPTQPVTPVAVVDGTRLHCDGIVAILDRQPDVAVVAVAQDASTALLQVPKTRPRVVLMDAGLGDHDTHRLVEDILAVAPEARVIVMDMLPVPEDVVEFIRRGASGFVAKDATVDDLVHAIRSVALGTEVLPPVLTDTLLSHLARLATGRPGADTRRAVRITARERQIIGLIVDGLSNKEIAQQIHLTTHTVKSHVHNILEKLALHSRLQLAAYAHNAERQAEA
jgi:DNA-binding NarL/FixJ family response regulator